MTRMKMIPTSIWTTSIQLTKISQHLRLIRIKVIQIMTTVSTSITQIQITM